MFVYPLRCAAALALLALVPAVAAQSRRQLTGVVVDAQGQPVADAALQLWADARVDGTGAETVTARSDTKGAVRLELRPGRRYSGWASAADRVSAVAEVDDGVEALRLTLLPVPPCRLALAQLPQSTRNPGGFRGRRGPAAQHFQGPTCAEGRVVPTTPVDRGA